MNDKYFIRHFVNPNGVGDWYVLKEESNGRFYGYVSFIVNEWGHFTENELLESGIVEVELERPIKVEDIV